MIFNKRGSQLEVIISFGIFIIFIVLLFLVIRPSKFQNEKTSLVKDLESKIPNYLSTDLIITSFFNKSGFDNTKTCFSIPNLPETVRLKVIVKDKDKNSIPAFVLGDKLFIGKEDSFFNIYYNEKIDEKGFTIPDQGCDSLSIGDYELGLIKNSSFISLNKTQKLRYDLEDPAIYNTLKRQLGVPDSSDFGFFLRTAGNEKIVYTDNRQKLGSNVEVYAEEFPISYIDGNANIKQGWINIQVW